MTTKPELATDIDLFPGLVAAALFGVFAVIFLGATFAGATGFETDAPITASIGYAMFNLGGGPSTVASEGFLATFEIIDVVLVAALVVAVMLARRRSGQLLARIRGGDR